MAFGIDDAIAAGLKILDKFIPDPAQKIEAAEQLKKLFNDFSASMNEVNKEEIKIAPQLKGIRGWMAQWRGLVGLSAACVLIYQFIVYHIMVAMLLAFNENYPVEKLPVIDWKVFGSILLGMLGLSNGG